MVDTDGVIDYSAFSANTLESAHRFKIAIK